MKKWVSENDIKKTAKKSIWDAYGPKKVPKWGPNGPQDRGTPSHFEGLETLWAAVEGHIIPRPPQRASKTPQDDDFLSFWD